MALDLLRSIRHYNARGAIGASSMRGAGSAGVVAAAQAFLCQMELRPFGTLSEPKFNAQLDRATDDLKQALPKKARHWGLARKGLNIFLRNCLYNAYLQEQYDLKRAEAFFEVPLDSITGIRLVTAANGTLPRWRTVRGLDPDTSARFQAVASTEALKLGIARVHLDAVWWGQR